MGEAPATFGEVEWTPPTRTLWEPSQLLAVALHITERMATGACTTRSSSTSFRATTLRRAVANS
jgi:hypothetical protein